MFRRVAAAVFALGLGTAGAAQAGIYTDDLSKCLVKATTDTDRAALMEWLFSAISAHPSVKSMVSVTPAQREATNRKAAGLLQRLLTEDCRSQTVDAVKYESMGAIQQSFGVLGQVAMSGLMQDSAVTAEISGMAKYLDEEKFKALLASQGPAAAAVKK